MGEAPHNQTQGSVMFTEKTLTKEQMVQYLEQCMTERWAGNLLDRFADFCLRVQEAEKPKGKKTD